MPNVGDQCPQLEAAVSQHVALGMLTPPDSLYLQNRKTGLYEVINWALSFSP